MKNEIPGLIAPTQAPQLEAEGLLEIRDLMMAAPAWDPMLAPELLHLCRNFVAVRSAIGFALELAQAANQVLVVTDEPRDAFRAQGQIRGLQQYFQTLLSCLEEVDKNKESIQ